MKKTEIARAGMALMLLQTLIGMTGCDKLVDGSKAVQQTTLRAFNDTKSSWKDFFTYHPPQPDPLPQTRYCYQMQSDVVCYDSEQTTMTSKLIGYQDGDNISWVQPGGGSLGASGGAAIALRPAVANNVIAPPSSAVGSHHEMSGVIDTGPVIVGSSAASGVAATPGQISVNALPPVQKK